MTQLIHSMIRVADEAASLAFYATAFDLTPATRAAFDGFTLIYLSNPESTFELELTVNHGRAEPYEHGTAYGHLAVATDDLDALHAKLEAAGYAPRPIREMPLDGRPFARFFFVADPDGYQIEVLERSGRFA